MLLHGKKDVDDNNDLFELRVRFVQLELNWCDVLVTSSKKWYHNSFSCSETKQGLVSERRRNQSMMTPFPGAFVRSKGSCRLMGNSSRVMRYLDSAWLRGTALFR